MKVVLRSTIAIIYISSFLVLHLIFINSTILAQSIIPVNVERIGEGICKGPESIAIDNEGYIYSGMEDGQIIRFSSDGSSHEVFAETGGRPLGLQFNSDGNLLACDAYKGLLSIDGEGTISILSTGHNGKPFKLTDDLDILIDGTIYFSDASYKYSLDDYWPNDYPHPNGRLLVYNPLADTTNLVRDSLYFANGVAISPDQSFLLVNETWKFRVRRVWISGPQQGQSDIFLNLSSGEEPDNITCNGKDLFWLAVYDKSILGLDFEGNIKYILEYPTNQYSDLTSVLQYDNQLYLGSLTETAIGRIQLPDSVTNIDYIYQNNPNTFSLSQNYPNPFNPSTTIEFTLPKSEFVELKVYNILGKKVSTLVSKNLNQGNHTYTFAGNDLASGVYYYRLEAENFTQTRKMIYLK